MYAQSNRGTIIFWIQSKAMKVTTITLYVFVFNVRQNGQYQNFACHTQGSPPSLITI